MVRPLPAPGRRLHRTLRHRGHRRGRYCVRRAHCQHGQAGCARERRGGQTVGDGLRRLRRALQRSQGAAQRGLCRRRLAGGIRQFWGGGGHDLLHLFRLQGSSGARVGCGDGVRQVGRPHGIPLPVLPRLQRRPRCDHRHRYLRGVRRPLLAHSHLQRRDRRWEHDEQPTQGGHRQIHRRGHTPVDLGTAHLPPGHGGQHGERGVRQLLRERSRRLRRGHLHQLGGGRHQGSVYYQVRSHRRSGGVGDAAGRHGEGVRPEDGHGRPG
mmetsp:Transcript_37069/g.72844  ORF Transcript_37069/g.72844 Transcript_37069/m.72844 type:complete len:267 (-) Transcript_37069:436-1236(-)